MNLMIPFKRATMPKPVVALVLIWFALAPLTQAVVPAPDGGYPGGNTAEGQSALFSLTTGTYNTAVGFFSLGSNMTFGFNTAIGAGALFANMSGSNTATGAAALLLNTEGHGNTANGAFALLNNTTGSFNTAVGEEALEDHTPGDDNTAVGHAALLYDTMGARNTAVGKSALLQNMGNENTAVGQAALINNTTGENNTAVGTGALVANQNGEDNTAIGNYALQFNTTGDLNVALGWNAGSSVTTADNVICIGASVAGQNVSNSCYIGQIWNQPGGSQAVYVNSEGKLGAQVSSRRFKDEIKPIEKASEVIYALKPVSFRYKAEIEPTRPRAYGFVAEDVAEVSPDLVTQGRDGHVMAVRYDAVNAMLLNEFLKEHRRNEEQEATITRLQKQIEALTAAVQKVSAQLAAASPSAADL
jgi:Chaperone of endosialidase